MRVSLFVWDSGEYISKLLDKCIRSVLYSAMWAVLFFRMSVKKCPPPWVWLLPVSCWPLHIQIRHTKNSHRTCNVVNLIVLFRMNAKFYPPTLYTVIYDRLFIIKVCIRVGKFHEWKTNFNSMFLRKLKK